MKTKTLFAVIPILAISGLLSLAGCGEEQHEPRMEKALEQQRSQQRNAMQSGNIPGAAGAKK
ncbi:hypothetical protein [Fimbriimonas ginsengisoli]|uniref:Lipoprotein n=1 Tax=Fimbriimonas ginsengisoli Gsoil 348 TaxID=661478 RepID=A0A068NUM2_FIMGI|nr:hypothetical protein [Fimbriimonas ginsengisoli]AIE87131.1 hypothetical protein OP10G_3763 [Fimbriimonas ginsengisoli Gsoil 348]